MTGPPEAPATGGEQVFVDYRRSGFRWRVVLLAAGLVVLLLAAGYAVRAVVSSPESAVRGFFAALAERDVDAALAEVAPEIADPVERELVAPEVLAEDGYLPPSDLTVLDVTVDGRSAVVEVGYAVDGAPHEVALRLRRGDGVADRLVPQWLVVDALGTLVLAEAPDEVTVNGHRVAARDPDGPRWLPALPGGYRVAVPADDPLWQERELGAVVHPQQATEVAVATVPHPRIRTQVEERVAELLDECAASAELDPAGCPFGYGPLAGVESVRWRIERYPAITFTAGRELGETVLVVETTREGEAVVSGERTLGGPFEARVPIPVSGVVVPRGGSVLFTPGW